MALPDQELIALLADLESDRVERKENAANSDRLSEAICAFANDMPGYGEPGVLFVGVSDNGAVLGRPVTDELLRQLADLRDQGTILPPPTMTVRKLRVDGSEMAVVEVLPSATPPVRFKGRVYIRVGPRRAIASLDEERRLNERRQFLRIDGDRQEQRAADYPLVALQQVARNAVMHRSYEHTASPVRITWYSDRVEGDQPGRAVRDRLGGQLRPARYHRLPQPRTRRFTPGPWLCAAIRYGVALDPPGTESQRKPST